jgi:membrane protease YdiL (CAAX protease family)
MPDISTSIASVEQALPVFAVMMGLIFLGVVVNGIVLASLVRYPPHPGGISRDLHARPWTVLDLGGMAGILVLLSLGVQAAASALAAHPAVSLDWIPGYAPVLIGAASLHLPILLLVVTTARVRGFSLTDAFGSRRAPALRNAMTGAVLCFGMMPVAWGINLLAILALRFGLGIPMELQPAAEVLSGIPAWPWAMRAVVLLLAIVVAPVAEEMLFRGVGLPALAKVVGTGPAIIIVSLGFAVCHGHVHSILSLFVISVCLCFAYMRTRSLLVPIVMHMVLNYTSLALIFGIMP